MPAAASARGPVLVSPQPRSLPGLERAKQRLDSALPQPSRRRAPAPRTQATGPGVFDGLDATTNSLWAGFTPSDSTGAMGPDRYVELVNSQIGIYDTSGNLQSSDDLQSFLIAKGLSVLAAGTSHDDAGDQIFDVQVQWDQHWNRWLIASDDVLPNGDARLVFGWSTTTDPASDWCLYTTPAGAHFDDFPKLGHDDDFVLIGTNVFSDTTGSLFLGAQVWGIPKPEAANTGTLTTPCAATPSLTQLPLDGSDFTPVPANIADDSTTGYVVATSQFGSGALRLYTVTNNAGTPVLNGPASIPVGTWGPPPSVQQPGTSSVIDSQDGRLTQAVATKDPPVTGHETIWTQHTVRSADGKRAQVRWYELDGVAKTKLQEGSIADPSNSVFNAAISPSADGSHAAISYDVGGRFHLVEARAQTRVNATTPAGTMENEITLGKSLAVAGDFTCTEGGGPCRWGDYAGASPDPSSATTTWGTSQLSGVTEPNADPSWTTINFALASGGPDLPPDTSADGFPFTSASPTPPFNFASSETGSTFQCSIDGSPFAACTPGAAFGPPLPNGTHDFAVFAVDAAGQPDTTPAHGSFTIAAPTPDTAIDSAPAATTTSRSVGYAFHASIPNARFQCSIDGQAWFTCASPFRTPVLAIGAHNFAVRAVDGLGNVDPTPAANGFTIVPEPAAAVSARRQRASRRWVVSVRVRCPASRTASCVGTVKLTSGHLKLGSARFRVAHGRSATVHVKLGRRARAQLARRRRLRVKAAFRLSAPAQRTTKTFTLLAPRRS